MFVLQSNTRGLDLFLLFFRFGKVVNKTKLLSEGFHKYFSRKPSSELDSNIDESEKALHEKSYELEVVGTLKVMENLLSLVPQLKIVCWRRFSWHQDRLVINGNMEY